WIVSLFLLGARGCRCSFLFMSSAGRHPDGHSFPTRRSSDLSGIAIAQATKNKSLELALTAMRARARQAKAVWTLLHPDCLRLSRSEEHTSELQSPDLVCRLLLEKKKKATNT